MSNMPLLTELSNSSSSQQSYAADAPSPQYFPITALEKTHFICDFLSSLGESEWDIQNNLMPNLDGTPKEERIPRESFPIPSCLKDYMKTRGWTPAKTRKLKYLHDCDLLPDLRILTTTRNVWFMDLFLKHHKKRHERFLCLATFVANGIRPELAAMWTLMTDVHSNNRLVYHNYKLKAFMQMIELCNDCYRGVKWTKTTSHHFEQKQRVQIETPPKEIVEKEDGKIDLIQIWGLQQFYSRR